MLEVNRICLKIMFYINYKFSRIILFKIDDIEGDSVTIFFIFFFLICCPQAPAYPTNDYENSRRYSPPKVHHRCQAYRWYMSKKSLRSSARGASMECWAEIRTRYCLTASRYPVHEQLSYVAPVLRIRDVYPGSDFFPSRIRIFPSRIRTKNWSKLTPKNGI